MLRIIAYAKYNAHTRPVFKSLLLLKQGDIWRLHDLKLKKMTNGIYAKVVF